MDTEIKAGRLNASTIWKPANWWERTNWEEAAILLAGLYSDDCTPVLNWLADANPEVIVQCMLRSGATTPDAIHRLRDGAAAGQSACAAKRVLQEVARGVVRVRLRDDPVSGERVAVDRRAVPVKVEDHIAIRRGFVPDLLARHAVKSGAHAPAMPQALSLENRW